MENTILIQNFPTQITEHFQLDEFFYPDFMDFYRKSAPSFTIPNKLISALELLRIHLDKPIIVTSVVRPAAGFHSINKALDFVISEFDHNQLFLKSKSEAIKTPIFKILRNCGITGIGFEHNHIHIDTRANTYNSKDILGMYCFFNK